MSSSSSHHHRHVAGAPTSPEPSPSPPRNPSRRPSPSDDYDDGDYYDEDDEAGGVKEDLSELTKTLTRQFWGVASFLAPPPSDDVAVASGHRRPDLASPSEETDGPGIAGIRSDFAEIGGRFRSGISKLSSHKAVFGISKIASNFIPFRPEDEVEEDEDFDEYGVGVGEFEGMERGVGEEGEAVGVSKEVKTFVQNISMHPETWLDFPLLSDDEDADDFELSDAQQEHAMAVERLSPRLAALRIELCPVHMSEGCFWKTYFVLLHPRLEKHDAELLSTPQIVEARELLSKKLQERAKLEMERFAPDASYRRSSDITSVYSSEQATASKYLYESPPSSSAVEHEDVKYPSQTSEDNAIDKSVAEKEPFKVAEKDQSYSGISNIPISNFDDDEDDDWLKEEEVDPSGSITIPLDNEDVSFSDLEDEDVDIAPKASKH